MNSKFKTSGVFTSGVDYFCLVCECRLYNEGDATAHISKPVHTKNFDLTEYFENKEDCVRKIKKWYFCELCNLLLATATRVRLHITEPKHVEYKNNQLLHRNGQFVVAFSNVQINDRAWNGIIDETCVICNTEFDNENIHKNETIHIIKLIQSKVEFYANKNIYRRTDDSSFQCLTCNIVATLNSIDMHFNLPEHKNLYQKVCCSDHELHLDQNSKQIEDNDKTNKNLSANVSKIENKEREKEKCQVISAAIETNVSMKKVDLDNDRQTENARPTLKSDKEFCDLLNAKNYVTKDEKGRLWCMLCSWHVDTCNSATHVNELHHQTLLRLHKTRIAKLNSNKSEANIINDEKFKHADKENDNVIQQGGILDSLGNFQKNNIDINFETQTAYCTKCSTTLEFNKVNVENHIKEHTKNCDKKDTKSTQQTLSKQNKKLTGQVNANQNTACELNENKIEHIVKKNDNAKQQDSILDSLEHFQNNKIDINFEFQTANCKKCSTALDFNIAYIESHIKEHTKTNKCNKTDIKLTELTSASEGGKTKVTLTKKPSLHTTATTKKKGKEKQQTNCIEDEIKKIAEINCMTYTGRNDQVTCNTCNVKILPYLKNLRKHVSGIMHKTKSGTKDSSTIDNKQMSKETVKDSNTKIPVNSFITTAITFEMYLQKDILINEKLCINIYSFAFMVKVASNLVCLVCKTIENINQFEQHLESFEHEKFFDESLILVDYVDEFTREVKPNCFHCGYCNILYESWNAMQTHLQSVSHEESKTSAQWRLKQYKPHLKKNQHEMDCSMPDAFQIIHRNTNDVYKRKKK